MLTEESQMNSVRITALAVLIGLSTGAALAQPAAGMGPDRMGAGPGASASGMGMGRGAERWDTDDTPGWKLMTPDERKDHQAHMRAMKSYDECKAYQAQHHGQMVARAKERGAKALAQPQRDACRGLMK
jgi:hypothetical protein